MDALTLDEIKRIDNIPLNFVMGKERSGTTLLQIMLNTHPNIIAPPESRFIMLLFPKYGNITNWTEELLTHFRNDIMSERSIDNFWAINKDELLRTFIAAKEIATYPLLCKLVFSQFASFKDVQLFFDKNPLYAYFFPELKKLFPDAKYIHLVRDYRATIVSHRDYRNNIKLPYRFFIAEKSSDIAYQWVKMNTMIENAKSSNPDNYFTLRYEELVSKPVQSITGLCGFLGIPYYEKMAMAHSLGIYPTFAENIKKRFREIHRSVFIPVTSSYIDKWEKALKPDEIGEAEAIAGEFAGKMYGYSNYPGVEVKQINRFKQNVMRFKYRVRNKIYLFALKNPGVYFAIKKYIWKYF